MLGVDELTYDRQVMRLKVVWNDTNANASVKSVCFTLPLPSLYPRQTYVLPRQRCFAR